MGTLVLRGQECFFQVTLTVKNSRLVFPAEAKRPLLRSWFLRKLIASKIQVCRGVDARPPGFHLVLVTGYQ